MNILRLRLRLLALAAIFVVACNLFEGGTHVREGQLFQPGVANYDHYFKEVHELQVAQNAWPEDRKASRRALVDFLKLSLDVADVTIAQATHERMVGAAHQFGATKLDIKADDAHVLVAGGDGRIDTPTKDLFRAIETTVKAELARRKALGEIPTRIDDLTKVGRELEPHVRDDFAKNGGSLASDVKAELTSSYDVLGAVSGKARTEAREAEDFVSVIDRAVAAEPSETLVKLDPPKPPPSAKPRPTATTPPPPTATATATTPKPPPTATATATAPKPPPTATATTPKPKPTGGGDEVFNP